MNWISSLFPKHWRVINLSAIGLLSLILIIRVPTVNQFVSELVLLIFYTPFDTVKTEVSALQVSTHSIDTLQATITEQAQKLELFGELERENKRLRDILGFEPPVAYDLLPAEVISVEGGSYPTGVSINRGAGDEIKVDLSVINQQGLVGRVTWTGDNVAHVQLLTDPANRVAARLSESREMGIVKTLADGRMILDNFPIQGQISVGDTVISSGLGGVYPAGLIVGTVANVNYPEDDPFADVDLTPAVNFFSIEELFILKPMGP